MLERIDTSQLPEPAVMSIAQDTFGFAWVGTQGGLARYDGYRFRNFLPDPSDPKALPDGYLRTLLADANGGLWIGTSTSGLVHFDAATEAFQTWRPNSYGSGPRSAQINALLTGSSGRVLIGGDRGLDRFDPRSSRFEYERIVSGGDQPVVWCLLRDAKGALWVGAQDGLYERPTGGASFHRFPLGDPHAAAAPTIFSLYEDSAGRLWAGATNALYVINGARTRTRVLTSSPQNPRTVAPGQQHSIIEPIPGVVWSGTDSAITVVDTSAMQVRRVMADGQAPGGLPGGTVVQFLKSQSGMIWIANHIGGLSLYDPFSRGLYYLSSSRPEIGPDATGGAVALAADSGDGRIWAGGFNGALVQLDPRRGRTRSMIVPNHTAVQALTRTADGALWIGTIGGLCRLDRRAPQVQCPAGPREAESMSVYTLLDDGTTLWIGGNNGLIGAEMRTGRVETFSYGNRPGALTNNQVRALYLDRRHRLWIGTENGLNRRDPNGKIAQFTFDRSDPNSIGPGGISALLEDRRGRLWIGANGGPLNLMEELPNGKVRFRHFGLAQGMPHENADGLAEDAKGTIWVATDRGLAAIDPVSLHIRAMGLIDGVSEGGYWANAATQGSDGTIFFGGLDGIAIVEPEARSPWAFAPPLGVTGVTVGRNTIPAGMLNRDGATIDLPADDRNVMVEFSALDFSAPQTLRYAYKLEGYDRDWVDADASHRVAAYTHLPPGEHTLIVRGTNRLGIWSNHRLAIDIRAHAAWYETWFFRFLVTAVVIVTVVGAHLLRIAMLRMRQHDLEMLVTERTRELSAANAKLQELSLNDPLTGLRNRRFVGEHLEADVAFTLRRYENWLAVGSNAPLVDADLLFFVIDLDRFKHINDEYGHHAGDLVLMQMHERLLEVFRESDFVARWGGDEFLAVARGSRRSEAAEIATRLRDAIADRPFVLGGGEKHTVSASIGFAAFPFLPAAPHAVSWSRVVELADYALYIAKGNGRNTWCGLAATDETQPESLARSLAISTEEARRTGELAVIGP